MLAKNGAMNVGSSLLSCLSPLAAPLLPSAPQEANAEGSRAGAVRLYSQLRPSGCAPMAEMG